jgi:hypothetical protein
LRVDVEFDHLRHLRPVALDFIPFVERLPLHKPLYEVARTTDEAIAVLRAWGAVRPSGKGGAA